MGGGPLLDFGLLCWPVFDLERELLSLSYLHFSALPNNNTKNREFTSWRGLQHFSLVILLPFLAKWHVMRTFQFEIYIWATVENSLDNIFQFFSMNYWVMFNPRPGGAGDGTHYLFGVNLVFV